MNPSDQQPKKKYGSLRYSSGALFPEDFLQKGKEGNIHIERSGIAYVSIHREEMKMIHCDGHISRLLSARGEIDIMREEEGNPHFQQLLDFRDSDKDGTVYILREKLVPFERQIRKRDYATVDVYDWAIQLCDALIECRQHTGSHFNLRFRNLFMDRDGSLKLGNIDFALIKPILDSYPTVEMMRMMAPEVYQSGDYSDASDVYSVGAFIYLLIDSHASRNLNKRLNTLPLWKNEEELFDIHSLQLQNIVEQALMLKPYRRFKSLEELKAVLISAREDEMVENRTGAAGQLIRPMKLEPLRQKRKKRTSCTDNVEDIDSDEEPVHLKNIFADLISRFLIYSGIRKGNGTQDD